MTFDNFKEDTIALLNNNALTDEEILDSIIYNAVVAKEKIIRSEYAILDEIRTVGLTD